jgi:HTH-type transcriptional regulator / antitoxin HigA
MTKTKGHGVFEHGIPDTFSDLCMHYLPRPIHDGVAHANAVEIIDALSGLHLNSDQEDYLEVIGTLVNNYEDKNLAILPDANALEVLRHLVEENKISTRELSRILGKDESLGSLILSGKRSITVEHAIALAKHFGLGPEIFLNLKYS